MKSQLNNALAFFQVVAIITNLSTFAPAKIQKLSEMAKIFFDISEMEYLREQRESKIQKK